MKIKSVNSLKSEGKVFHHFISSLMNLVCWLSFRDNSVGLRSGFNVLEPLELKLALLVLGLLLGLYVLNCLFVRLGLFRLRHPLGLLLLFKVKKVKCLTSSWFMTYFSSISEAATSP